MIFKREFLKNIKSLLIWSIILSVLIILMLSVYPQFAKDQKAMNDFLKVYPEAMKKAFGMDKLSFGTLMGYYGVEIYLMTTLIGSIYSALLASNIVAKESGEKTIEFLLAKPVLRTEIIAQKFLTVVINVLILNIVIVIVSVIGFQFTRNSNVSAKTFAILSAATLMLHMTFTAVSFLLSTIMKKTRNILSISMGIVFIEYFLHVMSGISNKLENLKYISIFSYVDSGRIINDNAMNLVYVFIMIAIILISVAASFVIYKKKDITV